MADSDGNRWAMGLGIRAGKSLLRAENALGAIQAIRANNDFNVVAGLRAARLELNTLAKDISRLVDELESPRHG